MFALVKNHLKGIEGDRAGTVVHQLNPLPCGANIP